MDKLSTWAEMGVGWCGRNGLQAREADVEMTGMGIISSPCFGQAPVILLVIIAFRHYLAQRDCPSSYRADTLGICAIITLECVFKQSNIWRHSD